MTTLIRRPLAVITLLLATLVAAGLLLNDSPAAARKSANTTSSTSAAQAVPAASSTGQKPTIVFVHGGYADSSCWNGVIARLQAKGYTTIAASNPLRGLPTDAPYVRSLLDSIDGPVVLVSHSMGGTVATNAAAGASNVKALVYVSAFVPDVGETQGELINKFPGSEVLPVSVPVAYTKPDGTTGTDLYLSKDGKAAFAADISDEAFRLLQATQRPFDADSFTFPTTAAAWKTIPSWGIVAGRDKAIPPAAERWMYERAAFRKIVELPTSSHVAMISHPQAVSDLIQDAAKATS